MSDLLPRLGDALDALRGDSGRVPREVVRAVERERGRALVQAARDDLRALRTRKLMRNIADLSADEASYLQWAPTGAARYQLLADTYSVDVAAEVRRP